MNDSTWAVHVIVNGERRVWEDGLTLAEAEQAAEALELIGYEDVRLILALGWSDDV